MQSSAVDLLAVVAGLSVGVVILALLVTALAALYRLWCGRRDGDGATSACDDDAPRSTPFTTTRSGDYTNRSM